MNVERIAAVDELPKSLLDRADCILGAFDGNHSSLSLLGITARTGLPKTTVYRAVRKMIDLKWIDHEAGRYSVGARLFELSSVCRRRTALRETALPFMQDLYLAFRETVHLAMIEGDEIVYIEKLSGHHPVTNLTRVGGRMPAHCTGLGKVLTAFACTGGSDPLEAARLRQMTANTITVPTAMRVELARIRRDGVGVDHEECIRGVECVAAPVRAIDGSCIAAMSVSVPAQQVRLTRLVSAVRHASLQTSRAMAS